MDRRFLLFLVLSFLLLMANTAWNARQMAQRQPSAGGHAAQGEKAQPEAPADGAAPVAEAPVAEAPVAEAPDAGADATAGGNKAVEASGDQAVAPEQSQEAEPEVAPEFVTLGSVDPKSPYRMGVTITNLGAAVRRVELSSPKYLDIHDRGGYLGRLELVSGDGRGLLVQAVCAGTPAAEAGVQVGDRLIEAGAKETTPLTSIADLTKQLEAAKPGSEFHVVIERAGAQQSLTARLRRRPLDVIRPESENLALRGAAQPAGFIEPPSFLFTLAQIDKETLKSDALELVGVDLTTAAWRIVDRSATSATFERRVPAQGLTITKKYELATVDGKTADDPDAAAYHLTLTVTIANESADAGGKDRRIAYRLDGPNGLPIEGWWYATKVGREWSAAGIRDVIGRYFNAAPKQIGASSIAAGKAEPFDSGALAFIGVDAQYFAAALLPDKKDPADEWIEMAEPTLVGPAPDPRTHAGKFANVSCRLTSKLAPIAAGERLTHSYTLFVGPKRPGLLGKYQSAGEPAYSLSDFVYYGWYSGVARAMVGLLHVFYSVVGNYGLSIIMLTVLVRGCMFPVSRGQAKSMAKMQELRPEMERIKEKFKGDQQKQAKAMQDLYRKHNVNPVAGCLPMLLQLPVFVGLYRGLAVDIELRQAPLFGSAVRWCSNLAAPDMFYDWSGFMPKFINSGEGMFGLGPYLNLLPFVTIALYLWQQQKFMPPPANEQAEMQQKMMKYMMLFMGLLFYKVPSGLCLYFIASSLWSIAERTIAPMPTSATPSAAAETSPAKRSSAAGERRSGKSGQAGAGRGKAKRGR